MLDFAVTQLYRVILDDINIIVDVYDAYLQHCNHSNSSGSSLLRGNNKVPEKMTLNGFMKVAAAAYKYFTTSFYLKCIFLVL